MIPAGMVESGERKRTAAEVSRLGEQMPASPISFTPLWRCHRQVAHSLRRGASVADVQEALGYANLARQP
jgi:hypothetical protein